MTRALIGSALALLPACGGGEPAWSVAEAESIRVVRGTPVRDVQCRGTREEARHRRFACVAAARRPGEAFDTVAIHYELVPKEPYDGPTSEHELENVEFIGGPGIP